MKARHGILAVAAFTLFASFAWRYFAPEKTSPEAAPSGPSQALQDAVQRALDEAAERSPGLGIEGGAEPDVRLERSSSGDGDGDTRGRERLHITGIVVENDEPAPSTIVRAQNEEHRAVLVRTGDDGRFAFDIEARRNVRIDALKGERLRGSASVEVRGRTRDVRIELRRAGIVNVTVIRGGDRTPVEGAQVSCALLGQAELDAQAIDQESAMSAGSERSFGPVDTNAEGKVTLFVTRPGRYEVEAEDRELGVVVREFALDLRDEPQELALELAGGSAISGTVFDEARAPVSGATIVLSPAKRGQIFGWRRAESDVQGRFRIAGVEAGFFDISVRAARHPYLSQKLEKKDSVNDMEIELVLKTGGTIAGRVVDARGASLKGWKVIAMGERGKSEAVTREDGSFVLEGIEDGWHRLIAVDRDGEYRWSPKETARAKAGDRDVILRMNGGASLQIDVDFEEAAPPAKYAIYVQGKKYEQPGTVRTSVFGDLVPGSDNPIVTAPGFATESRLVELVEEQSAVASFTLRPSKRVTGRVVDRATNAPIAGALLLPLEGKKPERGIREGVEGARSGADGTFSLDGLAGGQLSLLGRAEHYIQEIAGPFEVGGDAAPIVVQLSRGVRLAGRVHAGDQLPNHGFATIRAEGDREAMLVAYHADITAGGAFELEGVPPGTHTLAVYAAFGEELTRSRSMQVVVPAAGIEGVDVDFSEGGARLVVSFSASENMTYLMLERGHVARESKPYGPRPDASQTRIAKSGETEVAFDGIQPGDYTLSAHALDIMSDDNPPEQPRPPMYVTIKPGETTVRVALAPR